MPRSAYNPWLHRFALLTAVTTLALVGLGGLVTSKEAGMSVPDWPTSYGYNMFFLPISKWVGGVFYEHTHRLLATIVGTLVVILTRWLGGRQACKPLIGVGLLEIATGLGLVFLVPDLKPTGHFLSGIGGVVLLAGVGRQRVSKPLTVVGLLGILAGIILGFLLPGLKVAGNGLSGIGGVMLLIGVASIFDEPAPKTLVRLGWTVFFLVQFQGLLGGLRVVLFKNQIGIFHAALAQIFFVLLCTIALLTSRWWMERGQPFHANNSTDLRTSCPRSLRALLFATTLLIFLQLLIGATMRHEHAGLSIPDFPLAYHHVWPPMDAASVQSYNAHRVDITEANPITAFQILLQMVHRLMALAIFCLVTANAWLARRHLGRGHVLAKISLAWLGLICLQVVLGAVTIWSNKAADIATAHVVVGALSLMIGALLTVISFRVLMGVRVAVQAPTDSAAITPLSAKPVTSSAK